VQRRQNAKGGINGVLNVYSKVSRTEKTMSNVIRMSVKDKKRIRREVVGRKEEEEAEVWKESSVAWKPRSCLKPSLFKAWRLWCKGCKTTVKAERTENSALSI
jgi:hypothetical protein